MANVVINIAPIREAFALWHTIQRVLGKSGCEISGLDLSGDISKLIPLLLLLDSSDEYQDALFACLQRCTYNKEKITIDTFEAPEAREDYYPIILKCLRVNLEPFTKGLSLAWNSLLKESSPQE